MSKIAFYSQLFTNKRLCIRNGYYGRCIQLIPSDSLLDPFLKGVRTCDSCQLPRFYATDLKPQNITRSLQKWKKRKRKSKAQQKRELENLQEDLFKLLSRRVVKLTQDKTALSTHRDAVMTYSYTHLLRREDDDSPLFPSNIESVSIAPTIEDLPEKPVIFHHGLNDSLQKYSWQSDDFDARSPLDQDGSVSDTVRNFLARRVSSVSGSFDAHHATLSQLSAAPELSEVFTVARQDKILKPALRKEDEAFTPVDLKPFLASYQHSGGSTNFQALKRTCGINDLDESSPLQEDRAVNSVLNFTFAQTLKRLEKDLSIKADRRRYSWEEDDLETSSVHDSLYDSLKSSSSDITTKSSSDSMDPARGGVSESPLPSPTLISKKLSKKMDRATSKKMSEREVRQSNPKFKELCDMSYVAVCCYSGCEKLAMKYLKIQAYNDQCPAVPVFDRLIHALAKTQNMAAIKSAFSLLKRKDLEPSLQTYAGCLECIGRMSDPDLLLCEKIVAEIEESHLLLSDIASSCSFEGDEWDQVLKAIQLVRPDFAPLSPSVKTEYSSSLLQPLNSPHPNKLENNQYALEMTKDDILLRVSQQMEMEKKTEIKIPSIAKLSAKEEKKLQALIEKQNRLKEEWKRDFCEIFVQSLQTLEKKAENNLRMTIYPYLKLFPPEVYADIMIKHLEELSFLYDEMFSPSQSLIQVSVGRAINRKYNMDAKVQGQFDEKVSKIYEKYLEEFLDPQFPLDNHRLMWTRAMNQNLDTVQLDMSLKKWPRPMLKGIGKLLLDLVIQNLKVNANEFRPSEPEKLVPAFCTIYRPDVTTYTVAELKFHPVVSKVFGPKFRKSFTFDPSIVPMMVPPVPWVSKTMGGLLLGSNPLIRTNDESNYMDPLENIKDAQYSAVLDSLNALGVCAWKMNKTMLDLQIKIFNGGGDMKLKVAPPASEAPPMPVISADMNGAERASLYRERLHMQQQRNDMHSLWCTDLYRLSIANRFRDDIFWFPHSIDFRGRTYPLPPHFNHLGSDNVRGMLVFAKGKPLGKEGHDWLKIHLVNLTGLKKRCSNAERLEFANSLMEEVMDSAQNPLTGNGWWQKSDEPWQTLACCMELARIEEFEGNKEDYVCHFPVHQDGSCNGLQHYAALGRDQKGAESVNLAPFQEPQDVYSDVVVLVERERRKDAENGIEIAKILDGLVRRKVIKQTVMTTVYGVTRYGAKFQIFKQLKDIPELPPDSAWNSSIYLTDKTFSCLGEMFTATKDIQDWLTNVAKLISSYLAVEWVTPLGFPVVQPYFKKFSGGAHGFSNRPNIMKQKNAFPPNYIHSLDSTHMMLTSLYCMHAGITFVSVHDCYWTHASDVMMMNKICREQFVNMHKQPLLENLSEHLCNVVKHGVPESTLEDPKHAKRVEEILSLLHCIPERGKFNLDDVLESTYFFS